MAGGGAIAYAASGDTSSASSSSTKTSSGLPSLSSGQGGSTAPGQNGMGQGRMGKGDGDHGMGGGHGHTPVTGDELTKVKAAITAKDSAITVTSVVKDDDGSYDAFGTKDGSPVMVQVSADLKTVEVGQGGRGPGGMGGGMGGHDHTPVTGECVGRNWRGQEGLVNYLFALGPLEADRDWRARPRSGWRVPADPPRAARRAGSRCRPART